MSLRIAVQIDGVLANPEAESSEAETPEDFWERLSEIEPGAVSRLARMAALRQWEIIFLTSRPPSRGVTVQTQSQRWLESKGFGLPSVYVAYGARGPIASALDLDLVIDARPENCADVVENSDARAILVWPDLRNALPAGTRRPEITIVKSAGDCLDLLTTVESGDDKATVLDRIKRLLGLKKEKA